MLQVNTAGEMVPAPGRWTLGPGSRRRRIVTVILIVVGAALVSEILYVVERARSFYAIQPGTAPVVSDQSDCKPSGGGNFSLPSGKACVRLILPAGKAGNTDDSIMMVDVLVGPATPWQYFLHQIHLLNTAEDGSVIVPNAQILGTAPASQLACQDNEQMNDATAFAAVAALRRLGYAVGENDLGAQVNQVNTGTPAAVAGVQCNDLVTSVDGTTVHTAQQLVNAIHSHAPGQTVRLSVQRMVKGKNQTLSLTAQLTGTPAEGPQPAIPSQAFLGVALETRSTYTYPFAVSFQVGQIGGPSAGLAMTLALIDSLSHGQLTGGLRIAATGTIDPQGNVGDVGGVAQKAVAVRDAGAQVFFVPTDEYAQAKGHAGSMKVYPVSSLTQALEDLSTLGGHVPPVPSGQNGAG